MDRISNHNKNSAGQRSERKNKFLGQLLRHNKGVIDEKQFNDITFSENPKDMLDRLSKEADGRILTSELIVQNKQNRRSFFAIFSSGWFRNLT